MKNARQEKLAARAAAKNGDGDVGQDGAAEQKDAAYHEQMATLYRQHVLKEEAPAMVEIQGIGSKKQDKPVGVN